MENNQLNLMHLLQNYDDDGKKCSADFLKQKELFNKLVGERLNEIIDLSEKFNQDDLTSHYKGKNNTPKSFGGFDSVIALFKKIRNGKVLLNKTKKNQNEFKSDLSQIKKVGHKTICKKNQCTILKHFTKPKTW